MNDEIRRRAFVQRLAAETGRRPAVAFHAKKRIDRHTAKELEFPKVTDVYGCRVRMRGSLLRTESLALYGLSNAFDKGKFGKICLAERFEDGSRWAVKKVCLEEAIDPRNRPSPKTTPVKLERLLHEIHALKAMRLLEDVAWFDNGKVYLVIKLMRGDMHGLLDHLSHAPDDLVRDIARQTIRGTASKLRRLHRKKIVHLDLKPGNIFLTARARVYLGDFGLSSPCQKGGVALPTTPGTRGYVAPEVVLEQRAFFSSDTFSLGCTWLDFVTRRESPFLVRGLRSDQDVTEAYRQMFDGFARWRDGLYETREDGTRVLNLDRIRPGPLGTVWDDYFGDAKAVDPEFCAFVIDRMLALRPEERARSREVRATLNRLRRCKPTWADVLERGLLGAGAAGAVKLGQQRVAKENLASYCARPVADRGVMFDAVRRMLNSEGFRVVPRYISTSLHE